MARDPLEGECDPNWGGDVVPVSFARDYPPSPLSYEVPPRRKGWNGKGFERYYRRTKSGRDRLWARELAFTEAYVAGFLSIAPVLVSAKQTRIREVLVKLAMDSVDAAKYRPPTEERCRKHAFYLMNMPRIQAEIDRIMSRQGLSKERMAARLAEIMEGKATSKAETVIFDENDLQKERRVTTTETTINESMRAIDLAFRATTGYAPTNNRVQLAMDGNTYDAEAWKDIPEIAIDPTIERKGLPPKLDPSNEDEEPDGDSDEDEEEYDEDDSDEDDLEDDDEDD